VDTSRLGESLDPYDFFRAVQRTVIALLQNRSRPLWKRLFLIGYLCEKLDKIDDLSAIQTYFDGIQGGIGDDLAARHSLVEDSADLRTQLEIVLELIVARIGSDSNPPRFLECYREFIEGLQWTSKSTIDELSRHYAESFFQHYVPFMNRHEHMLEHYLVQYAFRTLFPFGLPESNRRLRHDRVPSPITTQYMAQYMWMAANYAIARTLLIGMAGFHKSAFSAEHVVKLVQSCTKTFEHSEAYPGQAIEILAGRNMASAASLCVLIRN
jgi:lysine-N-methylase